MVCVTSSYPLANKKNDTVFTYKTDTRYDGSMDKIDTSAKQHVMGRCLGQFSKLQTGDGTTFGVGWYGAAPQHSEEAQRSLPASFLSLFCGPGMAQGWKLSQKQPGFSFCISSGKGYLAWTCVVVQPQLVAKQHMVGCSLILTAAPPRLQVGWRGDSEDKGNTHGLG